MVSSRKRGRQEMEASEAPREPTMIERLRNMWEFANLAQWIFIFGRAVKIDENIGIEVTLSLSLSLPSSCFVLIMYFQRLGTRDGMPEIAFDGLT
jgi:hypothetical protein